jgi:hypothetical protein
MKGDAAMQAQYTHLDFVPTRKVAKIILEIPIEQADSFIAAFGCPRTDKSVPVAIARLDPNAKAEKPRGGKLAQWAGIVCVEGSFGEFLAEKYWRTDPMAVSDPVVFLRTYCGVSSRAELDHNVQAAAKFRNLMREFEAWKLVA